MLVTDQMLLQLEALDDQWSSNSHPTIEELQKRIEVLLLCHMSLVRTTRAMEQLATSGRDIMLTNTMTDTEDFWAIESLLADTSALGRALGNLAMVSDVGNLNRVKTTWPETWLRHVEHGRQLKSQHEAEQLTEIYG